MTTRRFARYLSADALATQLDPWVADFFSGGNFGPLYGYC